MQKKKNITAIFGCINKIPRNNIANDTYIGFLLTAKAPEVIRLPGFLVSMPTLNEFLNDTRVHI